MCKNETPVFYGPEGLQCLRDAVVRKRAQLIHVCELTELTDFCVF